MVSLDGYESLLELIDIVKVDFMLTDRRKRRALVRDLRKREIVVLAEKVETHQEFDEAVKLGCTLFQGYFFCKPQTISRKDIPGSKVQTLRLIAEVSEPEINLDRLEKVIKSDVALSMKLLKHLNSAGFGFSRKIDSIKHALALLGEQPVKKWAMTIALASVATNRPL